mgnify:CR=1 FL=1
MKTELKCLILEKISSENLKAFSCYDFTDLASYKTISKSLERMEDKGEIIRIIQGIYSLSAKDDLLKIDILPSIDEVAICLARKHRWFICPSGNLALNIMGLSTQVPANYVYLTSGPYNEYEIYGTKVRFKRTKNQEIVNYSYKTLLLIQCIKTLGNDNINDSIIELIRNKLSLQDKEIALKETLMTQSWIRDVIVRVCKDSQL